MPSTKASVSISAHYIAAPRDAVGYELLSLNNSVRFDKTGAPSVQAVSVAAFRREGINRAPLPVNSQSGAAHYVFLRCGLSATSVTPASPVTSVPAAQLKSMAWARFDLVAKADVTVSGSSYSYNDTSVLASLQIHISKDGEDGTGGGSTQNAFCRSKTQPATPSGGTYASPVPTTAGWSDAPPPGSDPLWLSRAYFTPTTTSPSWSTPAPVEDSTAVEYIFSHSDTDPGQPDDIHPYPDLPNATWGKQATGATWMALAVKNNGVWEPWSYCRIKGEAGADGQNAVSVRLDPPVLQLKKGQAGIFPVRIYVADGDTERGPVSFTTLTTAQKEGFQNVVYDGNVGYRFVYDGSSVINRDIPVTVNSKYHVTLQIRTIADGSDGAPGKDGAVGAVTCVTRWENNTQYYAGKTARPDGIKVLNIVYVESPTGDRTYYVCLADHTSSLQTKPGVGMMHASFWSLLSNAGPIFTEFLLAKNARIDLLDSQEIILWHTGDDGKPVMDARIGPPTAGNAYTIAWFGGATPADSPTWIAQDGTFHSSKAEIEGDVVFGGRVKPMRTVITRDNYKDYRVKESQVISGGSSTAWILDFSRLTGHVTFDSSLNSVSTTECPRRFFIGSKYPDQDPTVADLEDYIGSRLMVKNNTSSTVSIAGYVSDTVDNPSPYSLVVNAAQELHLLCFIGKQSSKKVIGWHVQYRGSQS